MNNFLALDIGMKRIGVARAHGIARIAEKMVTLENDDNFNDLLSKIIAEQEVGVLVIGLPRNLDGEETAQTSYVREFVASLKLDDHVQIIMYDEAVSSVDAESNLRKLGKPYSKGDIDAEAARIILQNYLYNEPQLIKEHS